MICPNCGLEIEEDDVKVCYRHNNYYCHYCADDNMGNCGENKADGMECRLGKSYDIPF